MLNMTKMSIKIDFGSFRTAFYVYIVMLDNKQDETLLTNAFNKTVFTACCEYCEKRAVNWRLNWMQTLSILLANTHVPVAFMVCPKKRTTSSRIFRLMPPGAVTILSLLLYHQAVIKFSNIFKPVCGRSNYRTYFIVFLQSPTASCKGFNKKPK